MGSSSTTRTRSPFGNRSGTTSPVFQAALELAVDMDPFPILGFIPQNTKSQIPEHKNRERFFQEKLNHIVELGIKSLTPSSKSKEPNWVMQESEGKRRRIWVSNYIFCVITEVEDLGSALLCFNSSSISLFFWVMIFFLLNYFLCSLIILFIGGSLLEEWIQLTQIGLTNPTMNSKSYRCCFL